MEMLVPPGFPCFKIGWCWWCDDDNVCHCHGGEVRGQLPESVLCYSEFPGQNSGSQACGAGVNSGHLAGLFFPGISLVTLLGLEIFLYLLFWSLSETRKAFWESPWRRKCLRQWAKYPVMHTTLEGFTSPADGVASSLRQEWIMENDIRESRMGLGIDEWAPWEPYAALLWA